MSLIYNTGITVTSTIDLLLNFKQFMVQLPPLGPGWVVVNSGQGVGGIYNQSGDVLATTGDFKSKYWFVLQDPSGNREISFNGGTLAGYMSILYSKNDGFTGGYCDGIASNQPTATDQEIVYGDSSGNPNSGLFSSTYFPSLLNMWADDSNEFSFGIYNRRSGYYTNNGIFIMEEIINNIISDYDNVVFFRSRSAAFNASLLSENNNLSSYYSDDCVYSYSYSCDSELTWQPISLISLKNSSGVVIPRGMGKDLITTKSHCFPVLLSGFNIIDEYNNVPFFKGFCRNLKYVGDIANNIDTYSLNSTNDYIVVDDFLLPWDGSVPVL
jgi:hypothetical protein